MSSYKPGNIGDIKRISEIISHKNNNCSIRIGVNAGSLEKDILEKYKEPCPEALVDSALRNIKIIEDMDFFNFKISVKSSDVFLSIAAYKLLSDKTNYPPISVLLRQEAIYLAVKRLLDLVVYY